MTGPSSQLQGFRELGGQRSALEQVALAATAARFSEHGDDMLVVAVRPTDDDRRAIASPGNSAIRAAVSVAVAAGNTRAWASASGDEVVQVPVAALPEIIRASVEPCGIHAVQVAAVRAGDTVACYTMLLSTSAHPDPTVLERHETIVSQLRVAVDADRARADELAKIEAAAAAARAAELGDRTAARPAVAEGSPVASLPDREHFDLTIGELQVDEAAVVVVGIDDTDLIELEHGAAGLTAVRDVVAGRIAASLRKHDVIAYVADNTFAIVLVNVDRHTGFEISRRLRSSLAEPLGAPGAPTEVSVSVGLAHQDGLIDPVEMFEAASSAMHGARHEGGARMLIAC